VEAHLEKAQDLFQSLNIPHYVKRAGELSKNFGLPLAGEPA
jgi:hypothetical protein